MLLEQLIERTEYTANVGLSKGIGTNSLLGFIQKSAKPFFASVEAKAPGVYAFDRPTNRVKGRKPQAVLDAIRDNIEKELNYKYEVVASKPFVFPEQHKHAGLIKAASMTLKPA